jgi:2Fe-2S ferredoxin
MPKSIQLNEVSENDGAVVRIEPLGETIRTQPGETLMRAAIRLGIRWPTICNGVAVCGVCNVQVRSASEALPAPTPKEEQGLRLVPLRSTGVVRLACQLVPQGELTVWRPGAIRIRPLAGD